MIFCKSNATDAQEADKPLLRIWQIDSFEGGKGSRSDFLQRIGNKFSDNGGALVLVTSISAEAARTNIAAGNIPDIISFGAGMWGIDTIVTDYTTWCHGGYCFLTLDGDFSDIKKENTIINMGKDNLALSAALFSGVNGAATEKSTAAYVKLINGEFKYLLGTQRDIFRLRTRGVAYKIQPVTIFNDLYQNIAVISKGERAKYSQNFVNFLKTKIADVNKLGMFSEKVGLYDDDMRQMEGLSYEYRLTSPIGSQTQNLIISAIEAGDINTLKSLLK